TLARDAATGNGEQTGAYTGSVLLQQPGAIAGDTAAAFGPVPDDGPFVDMGDVFAFEGNAAFSLELWVAIEDKPSGEAAGLAGRMGQYQGYVLEVTTLGEIQFRREHGQGTTAAVVKGLTPSDGRYYHAVATYDGSSMALYIDGTPVPGSPLPSSEAIPAGSASFSVGAARHGNGPSHMEIGRAV